MNISEKIKRGGLQKVTVAAILAAIVALVWGGVYLVRAMSRESTDDAFVTGHIISVSARVEGHVQKVYVSDNQAVQAGDLLVEIDPCDFQVKLDLATATLAAAQAGEEQARAQTSVASVEAKRAEKDYNRYRQLFDANAGVTQQQVDNAEAAARGAAAQLESANSHVAVAKARVSEARAGVEQAQLNLSYTRIVAPQPGRIAGKNVEPGEYIRTGQPLLALVAQKLWVVANFKETQLKKMKPGQSVDIRIDAYPQRIFKGHIDSIQAGTGSIFSLLPPENATGNYIKVVQRVPVIIVFDEDPTDVNMLSPGMSVMPVVKVK
jgi:membrane fusion protein (multidrug efflux system)